MVEEGEWVGEGERRPLGFLLWCVLQRLFVPKAKVTIKNSKSSKIYR